jgi:hypothetical protein
LHPSNFNGGKLPFSRDTQGNGQSGVPDEARRKVEQSRKGYTFDKDDDGELQFGVSAGRNPANGCRKNIIWQVKKERFTESSARLTGERRWMRKEDYYGYRAVWGFF